MSMSLRAQPGRLAINGRCSREPRTLEVSINPGRVLRVLLGCIAVLIATGFVVAVARVGFGYGSLYRLGPLFDLNAEGNIPAFFSSLQLLLAACLLAVLAHEPVEREHGRRLHWALLASGFLYLAFDEGVEIHERFNRPIRELLDAPGFETAWLVPAVLVLIPLALFYLPFLRALPRRFAALFLGSGLVFLAGAVGLESTVELILHHYGQETLLYELEVTIEEACEMLGVALFIYSLLAYLVHLNVTVRCRIEGKGGPAPLTASSRSRPGAS